MRVAIVYESMYGPTHVCASAMADALAGRADVVLLRVAQALPELLGAPDLLLAGAPEQHHGLSSPLRRHEDAAMHGRGLEPDAGSIGLREWMESAAFSASAFAAFETTTRAMGRPGPAVRAIDRALRSRGLAPAADPAGFRTDPAGRTLMAGEAERAAAWALVVAGARQERT